MTVRKLLEVTIDHWFKGTFDHGILLLLNPEVAVRSFLLLVVVVGKSSCMLYSITFLRQIGDVALTIDCYCIDSGVCQQCKNHTL
jgi:hypothetical protein